MVTRQDKREREGEEEGNGGPRVVKFKVTFRDQPTGTLSSRFDGFHDEDDEETERDAEREAERTTAAECQTVKE